eukprot:snap_masked-scaffold_1-processed-gene-17.35-mRNA-1 protein AED:1.00 eAED:1.00 QI:0/0/0/0/1/1/2/0/157
MCFPLTKSRKEKLFYHKINPLKRLHNALNSGLIKISYSGFRQQILGNNVYPVAFQEILDDIHDYGLSKAKLKSQGKHISSISLQGVLNELIYYNLVLDKSDFPGFAKSLNAYFCAEEISVNFLLIEFFVGGDIVFSRMTKKIVTEFLNEINTFCQII